MIDLIAGGFCGRLEANRLKPVPLVAAIGRARGTGARDRVGGRVLDPPLLGGELGTYSRGGGLINGGGERMLECR